MAQERGSGKLRQKDAECLRFQYYDLQTAFLSNHSLPMIFRSSVAPLFTRIYFALLASAPLSGSASVLFFLNPADQGSITPGELAAWHATLPLLVSANFGAVTDPATSAGTDLLSQMVGVTVNSSAYSMTVTEGGSTGGGTFAPSVVSGSTPGSGLSGFGSVNFDFERPAFQNAVSSSTWGYDTGSSAPNVVSNARDSLRFDFTGSATPVRSFSASLIDFESNSTNRGYAVAYDTAGLLLGSLTLDYGVLDGAGEGHQFAVGVTDLSSALGYLFFVVGDNTSGLAIGDFYLGSTLMAPEPNRTLLLLGGLLTAVSGRRRRSVYSSR
jgi:hypothetical protein